MSEGGENRTVKIYPATVPGDLLTGLLTSVGRWTMVQGKCLLITSFGAEYKQDDIGEGWIELKLTAVPFSEFPKCVKTDEEGKPCT